MLCPNPLISLKSRKLKDKYGSSFVSYKWFNEKKIINSLLLKNSIQLYPCRKCLSCINMTRYHWVKKLEIEKKYWKFTYFITLTYNNENLPNGLLVNHVQKFIKYYRRYLPDNEKIKYFAVGEYGLKNLRPHYHVIIFTNYKLDLIFLKNTKNGILYDCKEILQFWKNKGFITVAHDFNAQSFAYVSSYSNKSMLKQTQNVEYKNFQSFKKNLYENKNYTGLQKYIIFDLNFKDINFNKHEFIIMSKRPPIGSQTKELDIPSSLLKWQQKQWLTQNININNTSLIFDNIYYNELQKRVKYWYLYLKSNDLYDILDKNKNIKNKNTLKQKNIV